MTGPDPYMTRKQIASDLLSSHIWVKARMVKKKKKEGDFIANQPVTMSFYYDYDYDSCDDTSDNDIVFEDDKPTIISDPNDIDSDNDNSADDSNDASANESDSGDLMSSYSSTFVINPFITIVALAQR